MHDSQLARDIEEAVYEVFGGRSGKLGIGVHAPACCEGIGSMTIYTTADSRYRQLLLPVRIPEKHLFPSEAMLHFMEQAPLPTKRAKPRDWIEMAVEFARKVKAQYDGE